MKRWVKPVAAAIKGKGPTGLVKRAQMIGRRYGLTAHKMASSLEHLYLVLAEFDCQATLPVTAVALARNSSVIQDYQARGIEFAVHGYTHIDYSQLTPERQLDHLCRAHEIFAKSEVKAVGFRSPYLRRESHLDSSLEKTGFAYVSNQPILWDVVDSGAFTRPTQAAYQRAISFYEPWLPSERPSVPQLRNKLVEIPVSLPDDEILLDRLNGGINGLVGIAWGQILDKTHQRGELFTVQLHPERISLCADGLSKVLAEARTLSPAVWFARLDEIAAWWRSRTAATWNIKYKEDNVWHVSVEGPPGTTILARGLEVLGPSKTWADGYQQIGTTTCLVRSARQPIIGVSPDSPSILTSFLRQQGHLFQVSNDRHAYSIYLSRPSFASEEEYLLLTELEKGPEPLLRLGRWPKGARSALCVTGDVDALTLWDYGLRFLGR